MIPKSILRVLRGNPHSLKGVPERFAALEQIIRSCLGSKLQQPGVRLNCTPSGSRPPLDYVGATLKVGPSTLDLTVGRGEVVLSLGTGNQRKTIWNRGFEYQFFSKRSRTECIKNCCAYIFDQWGDFKLGQIPS